MESEDEGGGDKRVINAEVPVVAGDELLEVHHQQPSNGLSSYKHISYSTLASGWRANWRLGVPKRRIWFIRMFGSDVEAARAHRDLTLSMAEEPTNGDSEAMWNYITRLNTKESENALSPEERAGEFKCEVCTRVFNSAMALRAHGAVHSKKKKNIRG